MAISLQTTSGLRADGVKVLVYGQAGAGKTVLAKTLPNPIILSAEAGLLSLADTDIPFVQITCMDELMEAYRYLTESSDGQAFSSIVLDSISEIGETCLNAELKGSKDPRQAYGEMQHRISDLIRAYRDISGRHVYFTAKLEKQQDELGRMLYQPSMPGNKMGQSLPYFFDEVLALRMEKDAEGVTQRALMCDSDGLWQAKDRSGKLDMWELPDLGAAISKMRGEE